MFIWLITGGNYQNKTNIEPCKQAGLHIKMMYLSEIGQFQGPDHFISQQDGTASLPGHNAVPAVAESLNIYYRPREEGGGWPRENKTPGDYDL